MGGTDVQIRGAKTTIVGPVDISDRPGRLLGIIQGIVPTNPIIDYNTVTGLGSGSSGYHNYVTTGNFKLSSIDVSASGALKIEVKAGDVGFETTKMVVFTTESNLIAQLRFYEELQLILGQRIQIVITNRELQSQDIYSTILGFNI